MLPRRIGRGRIQTREPLDESIAVGDSPFVERVTSAVGVMVKGRYGRTEQLGDPGCIGFQNANLFLRESLGRGDGFDLLGRTHRFLLHPLGKRCRQLLGGMASEEAAAASKSAKGHRG
jgi:hypothetical protein